jgi:hypothetical protein
MAEALKILGQLNPLATTPTKLYTVPAATSAVVSSIMVTNQTAAAESFRVSVRIAGAGDTPKQYLFYDSPLPGNSTLAATIGLALAATDEIWVYASSATVSFCAFGDEVS